MNGKPSISITLDTEVNGKTYRDGRILLRVERLNRVKSTLRKIAQGQVSDISEEEADAMSTLWHEIVHNRHVGLESAGEKHSVSERCMEQGNRGIRLRRLSGGRKAQARLFSMPGGILPL